MSINVLPRRASVYKNCISTCILSLSLSLSLFNLQSADTTNREVTQSEIEYFQETTNLAVLPIINTNSPRLSGEPDTPDGREGIKVILCLV